MPALDRGLDVLESLAEAVEPQTLTLIARRLERTVSEVQRTVARLHERGYLVRDALGGYRLSTKLYRIAMQHPPFRDLVARALVPMNEYADVTGESCHICTLAEDRLLLVAQVEGRGFVRVSLQLGATQDPLLTVSGRILLAFLSDAELEGYFARCGVPKAARGRFERQAAVIRSQGYEVGESHLVEGVRDLGVPVQPPDGQVIATLTTSWLPRRGGGPVADKLLKPLKKTAQAIVAAYEPMPASSRC